MRIGFDLRPAMKKNSRRRGIGRYTHQLIHNLLLLSRHHRYVIYTLGGRSLQLTGNYEEKGLFYLSKPSRLQWLLDRVLLPRRIRRDRIEIFHATEITSIPRLERRSASARVWVHVHDLIPFIFWKETLQTVPRDYAYALQRAVERIRTSDLIITVSQYSKKDICQFVQVPESQVQVIYQGCSESLTPLEAEQAKAQLRTKYDLADPFLFYVGGSDSRKNLEWLVRAFAQIQREGYPGRLVLAGETFQWDFQEVRKLRGQIEKLGLESEILFPGYVPDGELSLFYAACDLFVFPSLYEGFGLPVLEAMKCGAPVLASRVSSIPEVGGEAVLYFDPKREETLVSAFFSSMAMRGNWNSCGKKGLSGQPDSAGERQRSRCSSSTRTMRVGIDCRALNAGPPGVATYVRNLLEQIPFLDCINHPRPQNNFLWNQLRVPPAQLSRRWNLYHAPAYTAPLVNFCPLVLTAHDVSYLACVEWYPHRRDSLRRSYYAASLKRERSKWS